MRALAVLLLCLPAAAAAGPWPREAGSTYALLQHESGSDWTSLYLERGGPRGLTFGLDLGGEARALRDPASAPEGRVRLFLRAPLPAWGAWLLAVEGGLGADLRMDPSDGIETTPRLSLGATAGRGLRMAGRDGWVTMGLRTDLAEAAPRRDGVGAKLGWKPTPRDTVELSLYAEREGGATHWTAGPFYQRRVGPVGLRAGAVRSEEGDVRLRLGVAAEF